MKKKWLEEVSKLKPEEEMELEAGVRIYRSEECFLVIVNVYLFGKPNWEEEALEGVEVEDLPEKLEKLGQELHNRMIETAKKMRALRKLDFHKSEACGAIYFLEYTRDADKAEEASAIAEQAIEALKAV